MGWQEINWLDEEYPDGYNNHFEALKATFEGDGLVVGAFDGKQLVGFVSVNRDVFGSKFSHVLLDQMFVDNKYQGCGIGKELFRISVEKVKEWSVEKLLISSSSSEDTVVLDCGFLLYNGFLTNTLDKLRFITPCVFAYSSDGVEYKRFHHFHSYVVASAFTLFAVMAVTGANIFVMDFTPACFSLLMKHLLATIFAKQYAC